MGKTPGYEEREEFDVASKTTVALPTVIRPTVVPGSYHECVARSEAIKQRLQQITFPSRLTGGASQGVKESHGSKKPLDSESALRQGSRRRRSAASTSAKSTSARASKDLSRAETTKSAIYKPPVVIKTDTHTDFLLKEMQWLAADFSSERKRHQSQRRKLNNAVLQHHAGRQARAERELAAAELKRRKLAAKMGRDVIKSWWNKIEKVVTYKQKCSAEQERRSAMDKQLVTLVQLTEKYTESLARTDEDGNLDENEEEKKQNKGHSVGHQGRKRRRSRLTIEQALAASLKTRKSKLKVKDYARINLSLQQQHSDDAASGRLIPLGDDVLYGESTTEDSGSDASYYPDELIENDDETTMREAERQEWRERVLQASGLHTADENDGDGDDSVSFVADPDELKKLEEEGSMEIEKVLERLRSEASQAPREVEFHNDSEILEPKVKKVKFAENVQIAQAPRANVSSRRSRRLAAANHESDLGHETDDDADASDVEDFTIRDENDSQGTSEGSEVDDEFEIDGDADEIDNEATIEEEEKLPQEMGSEEEIRRLREESEIPVDELRRRYAAAFLSNEGTDENDMFDAGDSDDSMADEEDYQPPGGPEIDDETTIIAEENLGRDMTYAQELDLLKQESEVPLEELRAMFYSQNDTEELEEQGEVDEETDEGQNESSINSFSDLIDVAENDDGEGDEYQPDVATAVDDETTIDAEEALGREMSYEDELNMLRRESEMSIDELRAMYQIIEKKDNAKRRDLDKQENDEDFQSNDSRNDETTIKQGNIGHEVCAEEEVNLLKKEGAVPVNNMRVLYQEGTLEDAAEDDRQEISNLDNVDEQSETIDPGKAALDALEASAERAKLTRASRPYLLSSWVKLREYQQVGLNWLVSLQSRRLNGILADEMGLGKTLQTIALLAYLAAYKGIWGPHLIVVPTSVILNWETELKRFCPAFKVLCYYGSAKRRKELRTGWTKTNWNHVVITSYQLAVQDAFAFKRKKWYYLVLDEAQNIKNFQSQRWQTLINFNSQRRLLLTGTPLQNSLIELWSMLHFMMPYIFRSRKQFSYWFANPMNSMIDGNTSLNDDVINRLHGIIRPFVLRRLKKDVETQMPGKFEHIIKCQLSRRQMFIYEEFMSRSSTRQALKKGGNYMGMMNVLMQLRKVCNHPDLFEPRSIITPFAMDPLRIPLPTCTTEICSNHLSNVSIHLRLPLWCGSCGVPSIQASVQHDNLESGQLKRLTAKIDSNNSDLLLDCGEGLSSALHSLLAEINESLRFERNEQVEFLNDLSSARCRSRPFPFPLRLMDAVTIRSLRRRESKVEDEMLTTPAHLLEMRRDQQQRADAVDDLLKRFVICVPKAGSGRPVVDSMSSRNGFISEHVLEDVLLEPMEEFFKPYQRAQARLSSFFPDKKLIQFDAGKLQTLAELLRELKRGSHKALIFTQFAKMLDILEAFLNLNGHTYLRLDGSTGVDRRQRLMDRFNNDPKIFCFILSTRSGGLGINLTGADTVIFYDSDWNPAIDAQAQDRAHRIGQTREVHIFRLITEHSVEENILTKARQKRNLDILVMDRGRFDASQLFSHKKSALVSSESHQSNDVLSTGGLRGILGTLDDGEEAEAEADLTTEQIEKVMTSLEDDDDVLALQGAQKEAAEELKEFDESIEYKKDEDGADEDPPSSQTESQTKTEAREQPATVEKEDDDLQKEFAAWQDKVGLDASAIEASLTPLERYGLKFREVIDPYYSIFAVMEYRRRMEASEEDEEFDIDELEREKLLEERRAIEDGDLLVTHPDPEDLIRQRNLYQREKARLRSNKRRRKLTGENWELRKDALNGMPYWYNIDTGEALWDKPHVLTELEGYEYAEQEKWAALPSQPLVLTMGFLNPYPERMRCAAVCRHWHRAATDISFVRHVYPVEMGAYTRDDTKMETNHYRTIEDAVAASLPGDTIELGDGHYWVNNAITVSWPLRFIGDENNPSNVVVELSGTIVWTAAGGFCEGLSVRRPNLASNEKPSGSILRVESQGRLNMIRSVLDNDGYDGAVLHAVKPGSKGYWTNVIITGGTRGILLDEGASIALADCAILRNSNAGISCIGGSVIHLKGTLVERNGSSAIELRSNSRCTMVQCELLRNRGQVLIDQEDGCHITCTKCSYVHEFKVAPRPGLEMATTDLPDTDNLLKN